MIPTGKVLSCSGSVPVIRKVSSSPTIRPSWLGGQVKLDIIAVELK